MPHETFPHDLPEPPLQRFYLEGFPQEYEGEIAWIDAESAVEAATIAQLLYTQNWGRFTKIEWISPKTSKPLRFYPDLEDTLEELAQVVDAQNAGSGE